VFEAATELLQGKTLPQALLFELGGVLVFIQVVSLK
jgi:hypothetical protein